MSTSPPANPQPAARNPQPRTPWQLASWQSYLLSVLLVTGATLISVALHWTLTITNLLMVYFFAVIIAALVLGRGPAILASILSALAFDLFLVPPRFTFAIDDTEYLLTLLGLFAVGVIISSLTTRWRFQAETAERRAEETAILNNLSRDLAAAGSLDAVINAVSHGIARVFGREVAVLLPEPHSGSHLAASMLLNAAEYGSTSEPSAAEYSGAAGLSTAVGAGFEMDEDERGVATWAFTHGQAAGRGTDNVPTAAARYLPLQTARSVVGVLGVKPTDPTIHLSLDQRRLLEAFASLAALAIERAQLVEEAERARVQMETERMRNSLLSSVSHDLRTPLTAITGAASSLLADPESPQMGKRPLDASTRRELTQAIYDEANRMNVLVRNLLDMTRLESGAIQVNKAWQPVEEVIGAALTRMEPLLAGRRVDVRLDADLPLAPLDEVSIEQVLVNLLENAIKYTPLGSPIELSAWTAADSGRSIIVEVADHGPGLAPGDEERAFEKFYRGQTTRGGVGLGLAICRGIVEAHGGHIWAENRVGGGASFRFELPIEGQPPVMPPDAIAEPAI